MLISGQLYIPESFNAYSKWTNKCGGIPSYIFCNEYYSLFCETSYKTNENVLQSYSVRNNHDLSIIDKVQTFKIGINKENFFRKLALIDSWVCSYIVFFLSKVADKKNILMSLIVIFFIIIFFIKSTTTFLFKYFLSFLIIFIINFKILQKKKIIVFSSVLLFFL